MKEWTGAYVCHVCKDCKSAFIAEDYTNAQNEPPKWRYCPACAIKKGIDYATQTPRKNRTPEEQKRINAQIERLKPYRYGNITQEK